MARPDLTQSILRVVSNASNPALSNPAVARCSEAWARAIRSLKDSDAWHMDIPKIAGAAYCSAMPPITDRKSISDYVACVAHGLSIGAIDAKLAGKHLYAAQVASGVVRNQPKPVPRSA